LKKWNKSWKIRLIEKFNPGWKDLYSDLNTAIAVKPNSVEPSAEMPGPPSMALLFTARKIYGLALLKEQGPIPNQSV
jgi:hypothetical protein